MSGKWENINTLVIQLRWPVIGLGLFVACITTALIRNDNAQEMRSLYQQLGHAQAQQDALQEEHSRLLLEKSAYSSLLKVEKIAINELNMVFPDEMDELTP